MTVALYTPKGKALEYAPLAVNLYEGCGFRCRYCYAGRMAHRFGKVDSIEAWRAMAPKPRDGILEALDADCAREAKKLGLGGGDLFGDNVKGPPVLLCFTCDPYMPQSDGTTRAAIEILGKHGFRPRILTKAAHRAMADFDLLKRYGGELGVTVTCYAQDLAKEWEPHAGPPFRRLQLLRHAKQSGLRTWLSLEPILEPANALLVVDKAGPLADMIHVGMMNHEKQPHDIDWQLFGWHLMERLHVRATGWRIKDETWAMFGPTVRGRWEQQRGTWE